MTIPVWVLIGFALWTILILISTIGVYRWHLIFTRRANLYDFPGDAPHGTEWYRRAVRAHANCIENLPIYTAIVVAIIVTNVQSPTLDILAITILIARICQSLTHIIFTPTNAGIAIRFSFFSIQLIAMLWMALYVIISVSLAS